MRRMPSRLGMILDSKHATPRTKSAYNGIGSLRLGTDVLGNPEKVRFQRSKPPGKSSCCPSVSQFSVLATGVHPRASIDELPHHCHFRIKRGIPNLRRVMFELVVHEKRFRTIWP